MQIKQFYLFSREIRTREQIKLAFSTKGAEFDCLSFLADLSELTDKADLLIIDLDSCREELLDFIRRSRSEGSRVVIICISDRTDPPGIVEALESGADAFVGKDASVQELVLRSKRILSRSTQRRSVRQIELDLENRQISNQGKSIRLTVSESQILNYLLGNTNRSCSPVEILQHMRHSNTVSSVSAIENRLKFIKHKLEQIGAAELMELKAISAGADMPASQILQ